MKTIGMIGGMSWESSSVYYQLLNREVQARLGGMHSARALLHSFDFAQIAALQDAGKWDDAALRMEEAGRGLAESGADFLIICCNTMHRMAGAVEKASGVPLLHIADPLGAAIRAAGMTRVGLLGSRHTMEWDDIVRGRLRHAYDLDVLVPEGEDFAIVDRIIYEELVRGRFEEPARAACRAAIGRLVARGAQGIVLGCTELPLLVKAEDSSVPLFDTTTLHAMAAVDMALA
ncbi:MAG TPA: aspartate/glutamate racemase family protein [Rhizomicrobium sp.]|jgi:aspartate racemase|nr:aspartate/glutamate racemase family protein [Rhizomicrobium sp.]